MKRIICGLLTGMLLLSVLSSCSSKEATLTTTADNVCAPNTANNDVNNKDYQLIQESDSLQLYFNENTTHFYVVNKSDGKTYYSKGQNPPTATENSLFDIGYIDKKGNLSSMSSYTDSVQKGQYKTEKLKNGLKVSYTLGNAQEELFCPGAISRERFEAILDKISDAYDRTVFKANYYLADYENIEDSAKKSELKSSYPTITETPLYILRQKTLPLNTQREINRILVSTGYTEADYEIDLRNSNGTQSTLYPVFNINLYLLIEDDSFQVKIPVSEIQEFHSGKIVSLNLLRNFTSPEKGQKGYYVLPDGSGSIMNFYSGKPYTQEYQVTVYGEDQALQQQENIYKQQQAYLPIFIAVHEDGAVLAEITDGDALAEIKAAPGSDASYAAAYAMFNVREVTRSYLSSSSNPNDFFYIAQNKLYDGDLSVLYTFFEKDQANISDLADYYSNRLFQDQKIDETVPPIYIEFIGLAEKENTLFGFKKQDKIVYTTLGQVRQIGQELLDSGVKKLVFKLSGFFNDGLDSSALQGVRLNSGVGTKAELDALLAWGEQNNVELYFDADVLYSTETGLFDGFSKTKDSSYLLTRVVGTKPVYNKATFALETDVERKQFILRPESVVKAISRVGSTAEKLGVYRLSFNELGGQLNADYKRGREVERQNAMKTIRQAVAGFSKNAGVAVSGANAYMLPYIDHAMEIPAQSSKYDFTDASIPFLQMVLKNRVSYSDIAVNLEGNTRQAELDAVRTGAGFLYVITANEKENFQKTEHTELTSTKYRIWKQDILDKAKLLNETYAQSTKKVSDYFILSDGVYQTAYTDGSYMIVNYTGKDFQYDGVVVKSLDYYIGSERSGG